VRAKKPRLGGALRETNSAGVTASQLKERGFDVGTHIVRIQDKDAEVFEVVNFAGKTVEIRHIYIYIYLYIKYPYNTIKAAWRERETAGHCHA
jgi:hypothetical protein